MSTPKPGQIRCPTCHESTPPAAFCTRCGQPIPPSALARPRGLDRDELEERLHGRRPGDSPYRRGADAGGAAAASAFDRFEPEPADAMAVRRPATSGDPVRRIDNLSASPDDALAVPGPDQPAPRWPREAPRRADPNPWGEPAPRPANEPEAPPQYAPEPEEAPSHIPPEADDAYYDYGSDYDYDAGTPYYADERGSGGPWLIAGIISLGLVALLGGVLVSGLFSGGPGVARETATPTVQATPTTTPSAEVSPTPAPSSEASQGPPGTFADGFTASVQPCATSDMTSDGCVEDGSTLSGDTVWVWAGFTKGTGEDVVGVTLVDSASGDEIQDASLELSRVNCTNICNGYLKFSFGGVTAGEYTLRVSRNGTFAAEAPFTVSG
ncbi:MAG TPA: hypothetical protein VFX74_09130 [Candidatus Limnocylindria bacterium]|nr:hypothetical protein [Candidatus Limnocylindria bacterium]